jgi:IS5 family transposase
LPSEEAKQEEQKAVERVKKLQPEVDTEATWVKKADKLQYGFKKHVVSDNEGMAIGVLTTTASVNEISNFEEMLATADLPKGISLSADKGYASAKNRELLKSKKLKDRILKRAVNLFCRNKYLSLILLQTSYCLYYLQLKNLFQ